MKDKAKELYELKLFEELVLHKNDVVWEAMKRVPGGWLHTYNCPIGATTTFIPFDNEFQPR